MRERRIIWIPYCCKETNRAALPPEETTGTCVPLIRLATKPPLDSEARVDYDHSLVP